MKKEEYEKLRTERDQLVEALKRGGISKHLMEAGNKRVFEIRDLLEQAHREQARDKR